MDVQLAIRRHWAQIVCAPNTSEAGPSGLCGRAAQRPAAAQSSSSMAAGAPPGKEAAKIEPSRRSRRIQMTVQEAASPSKRRRRDSVGSLKCTPELEVDLQRTSNRKDVIATKECASVDTRKDLQAQSNTDEIDEVTKSQFNQTSSLGQMPGKECASVVAPQKYHEGSLNGTAELEEATKTESTPQSPWGDSVTKENAAFVEPGNDQEMPSNGTPKLEATKTKSNRVLPQGDRVVKESAAVSEQRNVLGGLSNGTAEVEEATKTESKRKSRRSDRIAKESACVVGSGNKEVRPLKGTVKLDTATSSQSNRILRRSDRVAKECDPIVKPRNNHFGPLNDPAELEETRKSQSNLNLRRSDRVAKECASIGEPRINHMGSSNDTAKLEKAIKCKSNLNLRRSGRVEKENASVGEPRNNHVGPSSDTAKLEGATRFHSNRNLRRNGSVAKESASVGEPRNNHVSPSNDTAKLEGATRFHSNRNLRRNGSVAKESASVGEPRNNHVGPSNDTAKLEGATRFHSNRNLRRNGSVAKESASVGEPRNNHVGQSNDAVTSEEATRSQSNRNSRRSDKVAKETASVGEPRNNHVGPSNDTAKLEGATRFHSNRNLRRNGSVAKESASVGEPRNNHVGPSNDTAKLEGATRFHSNRNLRRNGSVAKESASVGEPRNNHVGQSNDAVTSEEATRSQSNRNSRRSDKVAKETASVGEPRNNHVGPSNDTAKLQEATRSQSHRKSRRGDKEVKETVPVPEPRNDFKGLSNGTAKLFKVTKTQSNRKSRGGDKVMKERASAVEPRENLEDPLTVTAMLEDPRKAESNRRACRDDRVANECASVSEPRNDLEGSSNSTAELEEVTKIESNRKLPRGVRVVKESASEPQKDLEKSNGTADLEEVTKTASNRKSPWDEKVVKESEAVEPRIDFEEPSNGTTDLEEANKKTESTRKSLRSARVAKESAVVVEPQNDPMGPSNDTMELEEATKSESSRKSPRSDRVMKECTALAGPRNDLEGLSNNTMELEEANNTESNRKTLSYDTIAKESAAVVEPRNDFVWSLNGTAELGETSESESNEERQMNKTVSEEFIATQSRCDSVGPSLGTLESAESLNSLSCELALECDVDVEALVPAARLSRGNAESSLCAPDESHVKNALRTNMRSKQKCGEQCSEKNDSAVKLRQCSTILTSEETVTFTVVKQPTDAEVEEGEVDVEAMVPAARLLRCNAETSGFPQVVREKRATKLINTRSNLRTCEVRSEEDVALEHWRRRCTTQKTVSEEVDVEELVHRISAGSPEEVSAKRRQRGTARQSGSFVIGPQLKEALHIDASLSDTELDVETVVPAARLQRSNESPSGGIPQEGSGKRRKPDIGVRPSLKSSEVESDEQVSTERRHLRNKAVTSGRSVIDLAMREATRTNESPGTSDAELDVEVLVPAVRLQRRNVSPSVGFSGQVSEKSRKPYIDVRPTSKSREVDDADENVSTVKRRRRNTAVTCKSSVIACRVKEATRTDESPMTDAELDVEAVVPVVRLQRRNEYQSVGISEKVSKGRKPDTDVRPTSKSREVNDSDEDVSSMRRRLQNRAVTSECYEIHRRLKEATHTDETPMTSDAELDVEAVVPAVRMQRSNESPSVNVLEKVFENTRISDTDVRSKSKSREVGSDVHTFTTRRRQRNTAARSPVVDPHGKKPAGTEAIRMTQDAELDVEELVPAMRLRRDIPVQSVVMSEVYEKQSASEISVCRRMLETEENPFMRVTRPQRGATGLQSDTPRDSADIGGKRKAELEASPPAMKQGRAAEVPLTDSLETSSDDKMQMGETVSITRHESGSEEPLTKASEISRVVQENTKTESSQMMWRSNEVLEETLSASEQDPDGTRDTHEAKEIETDSSRNMRGREEVIEECSLKERRKLRDTGGAKNESQEVNGDVVNSVTPASAGQLASHPEAKEVVDAQPKQGVKGGPEAQVDPTTRTKRPRCGPVVTSTGAPTAKPDSLRTESNESKQGIDIDADEKTGATRQPFSRTITRSEVFDAGVSSAAIQSPNQPPGPPIEGEEKHSSRKRLESEGTVTDTARAQVGFDGSKVNHEVKSDAADPALGESNASRIEISAQRQMEAKKETLERIRANIFRKVGSRTQTLVPVIRKLDDVSAAVGDTAKDNATASIKEEPDVPTASAWAATEEADDDDDDDIVEMARIISPPRGVIMRGPLCPPGPPPLSTSPRPGVIVHGRHVAAATAATTAAAAAGFGEKASATSESLGRPVTSIVASRSSERPGASGGGPAAEEAPPTTETDAPHATADPRPEPRTGTRAGGKAVLGGRSGSEKRQTAGHETESASETDSASGVGSGPGFGCRAPEMESETESASVSEGEGGAGARVGSGPGCGLEPRAVSAEAAARAGQWVRLVQLLVAGADPDAPGPTGARALHHAAVAGHVASVRSLLAHGAHVRARGADDQEALHCAAAGGSAACVSLLVAAGADVDAGDSSGWTALHWAAAAGCEATSKALLRAGASRHMADRRGHTPAAVAQGAARALIRRLGRSRPRPQAPAPAKGSPALVK